MANLFINQSRLITTTLFYLYVQCTFVHVLFIKTRQKSSVIGIKLNKKCDRNRFKENIDRT